MDKLKNFFIIVIFIACFIAIHIFLTLINSLNDFIIIISAILTNVLMISIATILTNSNCYRSKIIGYITLIILLAAISTFSIWQRLHINSDSTIYTLNISHFVWFVSYYFFSLIFIHFIVNIFTKQKNDDEKATTFFIVAMIFMIPMIILGLLLLDIVTIFNHQNLSINQFYQSIDNEVNNRNDSTYLGYLYTGAFISIAFLVTLYNAYTRHKEITNNELQFQYSQQQKQQDDIEKRFQEGIQLLGNDNESVRLGGIYVLWEIIKSAAKYQTEYINLKNIATNTPEKTSLTKAYELHSQILNILCAHIRTKTNSKEYLLEYYPSIAKERFPKAFAERYGETKSLISKFTLNIFPKAFTEHYGKKGEYNSLNEDDEKPSNEIQTLMNLLVKSEKEIFKSENKNERDTDKERDEIPAHSLKFILNFEKAILKGGEYSNAYFTSSICMQANLNNTVLIQSDFTDANFSRASFKKANCKFTLFIKTKLSHVNFSNTWFPMTFFINSDCSNAIFDHANIDGSRFLMADLSEAYFNHSKISSLTHFIGCTMSKTRFFRNTLRIAKIISGINTSLGEHSNFYDYYSPPNPAIILVDENNEQELTEETFYRINRSLENRFRISLEDLKYIDIYPNPIKEKLQAYNDLYKKVHKDNVSGSIDLKQKLLKSMTVEQKKDAVIYFSDFDSVITKNPHIDSEEA